MDVRHRERAFAVPEQRDQGQEQGAGAEFDGGDGQRTAAIPHELVESAEHRAKHGRQHAHRYAESHVRGHAADDQRNTRHHRHTQQQFARFEPASCHHRLDDGKKHRCQCETGGRDRGVCEFHR